MTSLKFVTLSQPSVPLSDVANFCKSCTSNHEEMVVILKRTEQLDAFNDASYLISTKDALKEASNHVVTNLKRIVNYLLIDGCLEDFETPISAQNQGKVMALKVRNEAIIAQSKALLNEATTLVNSYNSVNDDEVLSMLNSSIQAIRALF